MDCWIKSHQSPKLLQLSGRKQSFTPDFLYEEVKQLVKLPLVFLLCVDHHIAAESWILLVFQVLLEVLTGRRALEKDGTLGKRYLVREHVYSLQV